MVISERLLIGYLKFVNVKTLFLKKPSCRTHACAFLNIELSSILRFRVLHSNQILPDFTQTRPDLRFGLVLISVVEGQGRVGF